MLPKYRFNFNILYLAIFLLAILSLNPHFVSTERYFNDETSYLSHAFTIGLDFDLDYSNEIRQGLEINKFIPPHPIGVGVLSAPFVFLFSIIDRIVDHPIILNHNDYKNSWSLFGFILSVQIYFFMGILLYWKALSILFNDIKIIHVMFIILSTGMLYYVLNGIVHVHAFEFFILSLVLWCSIKLNLCKKKSRLRWIFSLSIALFIGLLTRYNNINMLIIPLFIFGYIKYLRKEDFNECLKEYKIIFQAIIISLILFAVFSFYFFDMIFPIPSRVYGHPMKGDLTFIQSIFQLISHMPNLIPLFIGSEFGLLFSNPILLFGLFYMIYTLLIKFKENNSLGPALIIVLFLIYNAMSYAIVLRWQTTASAYGYRYLFVLIPLCTLSTYHFLFYNRKNHRINHKINMRKFAKNILYTFCVISIISQLFFKTSKPLMPKNQINIYGVSHHASVKGYNYNLFFEIFKPKTWIILGGRSSPGFLFGSLIMNSSYKDQLPRDMVEIYSLRYDDIPFNSYLQILIIILFWFIFLIIIYGIDNKKSIIYKHSLLKRIL